MIADRIENASRYHALHPRIARALEFLGRADLDTLAEGRHAIEGDQVYALVQHYTTEPASSKRWESHRRYVDVQYVASGVESMGWAARDTLTVTQTYAADKDVELHGETADATAVRLDPRFFCILFPTDAHKPGCARGEPTQVRKVVVKVLL
jgi:biofilm protein TabA